MPVLGLILDLVIDLNPEGPSACLSRFSCSTARRPRFQASRGQALAPAVRPFRAHRQLDDLAINRDERNAEGLDTAQYTDRLLLALLRAHQAQVEVLVDGLGLILVFGEALLDLPFEEPSESPSMPRSMASSTRAWLPMLRALSQAWRKAGSCSRRA